MVNTPAADMGDQIPDEVKEARNQELLGLLEANSNRRNATLQLQERGQETPK